MMNGGLGDKSWLGSAPVKVLDLDLLSDRLRLVLNTGYGQLSHQALGANLSHQPEPV